MERGEADGILAWHPDRLARNSIDGGRIIFLIDTEKIKALKSPTFWFEPTPQGKFMLNIAFGQSKYFVDNLSENTKRGLRQKLRRGELPGYAPLGYLNDLLKHTMYKDPERFRLVRKLFELYATGNYSLKDLRKLITSAGLLSRKKNMLSVSNIQSILSNSFYYGVFKYNGEMYDGHNYYRCTKKRDKKCSQKYIREEVLADLVANELQKVSLSSAWAEWMLNELNKEEAEAAQSGVVFAQNLKDKIKELEGKLDILLDAHLDGTISREEYTAKKEKIINEKSELSEKSKDFERNGNHWLEPARQFILAAQQAKIIALQENPVAGRDFLKRIGSNRVLLSQKVAIEPKKSWQILYNLPAEARSAEAINSQHTIWLRTLNEIRTFFSENPNAEF